MPDDVTERVKKVVAKVLGAEESSLTEKTSFAWDLGAESLDSIKLVAAFEEEFGVELDEDAAFQVQNVGRAAEFIREHLKG